MSSYQVAGRRARALALGLAVAFWAGGCASLFGGADAERSAWARKVTEEAMLLLDRKGHEVARARLEQAAVDPVGQRDPLVWLALAHVELSAEDVVAAGDAFLRASELGAGQDEEAPRWARELRATFERDLGAVILLPGEGVAAGTSLRFPVRPETPFFDPRRAAVFQAVARDPEGTITRTVGKPFFLPAGRYQLRAGAVMVVAPGRTTKVPAHVILPWS